MKKKYKKYTIEIIDGEKFYVDAMGDLHRCEIMVDCFLEPKPKKRKRRSR
jgi:hypothetical protein